MSIHVKRFCFDSFKDLFGGEEFDEIFRFDTHIGLPTEKFKTRRGKRGGGFFGYRVGGHKSGYKSGYDYKSSKQNCTFKVSHRYDKALNKKHLAYIQKEGKGLNGSDPELYGAKPESYEQRMGKLHYRWIISPENLVLI